SADHLLSHSLLPLSLIMPPLPPSSTLFPYTTLFRSQVLDDRNPGAQESGVCGTSAVRIVIDIEGVDSHERGACRQQMLGRLAGEDRKSTRLNSSHGSISYAVFCLKKKKKKEVLSIKV